MSKRLLLAASAALALIGTGGVSATGIRPVMTVKNEPKHTIRFPLPGAKLLYDQSDNDNAVAIDAQNFESASDVYDCEGADDFTIPAGQTWKISAVYADGTYFSHSGPAQSYNVTFYTSKKGKVGKAVTTCANADYIETGFGSPQIKCKAKLGKGAYFVAVQANIDFSNGGLWGWFTNNTVRRSPSVWRNPGDGFDTGCTTFMTTTTCIPSEEGGDFSYALYGKQENEL